MDISRIRSLFVRPNIIHATLALHSRQKIATAKYVLPENRIRQLRQLVQRVLSTNAIAGGRYAYLPAEEDTVHYSRIRDLILVDFYEKKLLDRTFVWSGPTSHEDRIPTLHAARALAYIGDAAVPALFRAAKDKSVDFVSICDALAEIGLPVDQYLDERHRGDTKALEKWWAENRTRGAAARSEHRKGIGLPPVL